jgi:RHS repeat-associated protein
MIQDGNNQYYPAYDGNGNITGLLDNSGNAVAVYEYSPFGELLRCEGNYARENPFQWSTKWADRETGLVYYGRRYYDPRLGRWVSRDPIEEMGGLNVYDFLGNSPIGRWDMLGLDFDTTDPRRDQWDDVVLLDRFDVNSNKWTAEDEYWYQLTHGNPSIGLVQDPFSIEFPEPDVSGMNVVYMDKFEVRADRIKDYNIKIISPFGKNSLGYEFEVALDKIERISICLGLRADLDAYINLMKTNNEVTASARGYSGVFLTTLTTLNASELALKGAGKLDIPYVGKAGKGIGYIGVALSGYSLIKNVANDNYFDALRDGFSIAASRYPITSLVQLTANTSELWATQMANNMVLKAENDILRNNILNAENNLPIIDKLLYDLVSLDCFSLLL